MRSTTRYTLASALLTMASLTQPVCGHTWVESLSVIAPNGTFTGSPGYPRGNVLRTSPSFGDPAMTNLIPPNGRPNKILPTDMMCKSTQQNMVQTDGSPRLKAPAGSFVALRYQENGHVTLPDNQPGKAPNRGTVYVYGTTQPKPDDTFLSIHKVWNSDGSGGDKRGVLLASQPYDDGQCYQVNGGKISATRQAEFKHTANQLMGGDLWCQNDVKLPSDATSGKPYTLYWVWDWPTAPGADPGLPKGKEEVYTTCMDIDITAANEQKSVAKFVDGQPVDNAGIKSYLNGAGAEPTAAVTASSQPANPVATPAPSPVASSQSSQGSGASSSSAATTASPSMSASSLRSPTAAPQASHTAAAVSQIGDGQLQVPVPATSSQAAAPAPPPAPALSGITTVYVTKTVTAPTETASVAVSGSSVAPLVHAPSPTTAYTNLGSAKFSGDYYSKPQFNSKDRKRAPDIDPNPSSSTAGFFQAPPRVDNQYYEDAALQRILVLYLPSTVRSAIEPDLSRFGREVLTTRVLDWVADAEKNPPFLRTWDTLGRRRDELVTSAEWRKLQDMGIVEGMVAIAYEGKFAEHSRLYQFIKYHLWTGSCATVTCPSAMTDGAVRLLSKQISHASTPSTGRQVLEAAYSRLVSRNPPEAWTSGQWMTERADGSDVSGTETQAIYAPGSLSSSNTKGVDGAELGPWLISGFKWFSSATDSSMTVLLARTPKGVSPFYAPMRRTISDTDGTVKETELHGVSIQRLKSKLGTRPLPTAELELKGMRGYLLGEEGKGIKEIATPISRAFARVRKAGGKPLAEVLAHVRTMATQHVNYGANMHLTFFTVALLGLSDQVTASRSSEARHSIMPSSQEAVQLLLRVLAPVTKALTAKAAIAGLAECMESPGGVDYLENEDITFNIAWLFRDANVLSIWEGATDIMANDMVKVLKGRSGGRVLAVLSDWVAMTTSSSGGSESKMQEERFQIMDAWTRWKRDIESSVAKELQVGGRDVMKRLGWIVCAVLLVADACRDNETATREVARRWIQSISPEQGSEGCWEDAVKLDKMIVFPQEARTVARL